MIFSFLHTQVSSLCLCIPLLLVRLKVQGMFSPHHMWCGWHLGIIGSFLAALLLWPPWCPADGCEHWCARLQTRLCIYISNQVLLLPHHFIYPAPNTHCAHQIGFSLTGCTCKTLCFWLGHFASSEQPSDRAVPPKHACSNRHLHPCSYGQGVGTGMKIIKPKAWAMKGSRPDLLGR